MPLSMGLAVIATGNHWVLDVVIGGIVALLGGAVGRHRMRRRMRDQSGVVTPTTTKSPSPDTRVPLVDEVGT
jgi:membrane-associated phospholipid phosphatase